MFLFHLDDVLDDCTPGRRATRTAAHQKMVHHANEWKKKGIREGGVPIPVGEVVTIATTIFDRSHTDDRRLPGVVVEVTNNNNTDFYKIGVVGGVLKDAYQRGDLVHEPDLDPMVYGLEDVEMVWKTMKRISVRQGVANISMTGGQGFLKCACTTACRSLRCACFKSGMKCNSRCHPKSGGCLNHDECEREIHDLEDSSDEEPGEEIFFDDSENAATQSKKARLNADPNKATTRATTKASQPQPTFRKKK